MITATTTRFYKTIATLFSVVAIVFNSIAQDFRFSHITEENGLSQGVVNCILQDSRGFMWFGTQDGLNRYDGYTIKKFKQNPGDTNSISNNFILSLFEDNKSILWIGTSGGGLDEYNLSTGKFISHQHNPKNNNSISDDNVHVIFQDNEGLIWAGTENGLVSFDKKSRHFTKYLRDKKNQNTISSSFPTCMLQTRDGLLWIGTKGGGLNSFDKKTNKFVRYLQPELKGDEASENINLIRSIYEDENEVLLLGTDGKGIQRFDTRTKSFITNFNDISTSKFPLSNAKVLSIKKDKNDILWIGTFGSGMDLYNKKTGQYQNISKNEKNPDGLNENSVRCVFHDNVGTVWVGTEGGGINIYYRTKRLFETLKKRDNTSNSLQNNTVFTILEDRDSLLWIGTGGGGLSTLNRRTDTYEQYPQLSPGTNNSILSLCEDSDGLIWVGTYGNGLCSYDKKTKKVIWYKEFQTINSGTILNIFEDSQKNIWVCTYSEGVFVYDKSNKTFKNISSKNGLNINKTYFTFEDSKHNIWIGTDGGGVNKLNVSKGASQYYVHDEKKENTISSNTVLCMYEDKQGNFWFGTQFGLNKLNTRTNKFEYYFEKDGLPNDVIYCIMADDSENLWMSTNNGVSKFSQNIKNINGHAFNNYDYYDGLQRLEFNQGGYFQNKKGEMFLGGGDGLNIFNPNHAQNNKNIPPVYIISYKRSGKEVPMDSLIYDKKHLELSWHENFFSFDFVALNYLMSGKNKYQYKLEGVDADWSPPSTQRYASYTELSGGDYVFRVRASNNDGIWNDTGTSLTIRINPPYWRTSWFYALCITLTISGFWGFFRYRTRAIKRENKLLEEKVEERTVELAQKNKDITSSIEYAKRIQLAILPPLEQIFKHFPDSFVLYKPKDIVSGDFYWFGAKDGKNIIAVVDCTGHGVPGAFMSMIGHNLLNQIVSENGITQPNEILISLHHGIQSALRQGTNAVDTSDGMDVAICCIDIASNELQFAGALRPLLIINKDKFEKIEASKSPIGGSQFGTEPQFTNHIIKLSRGDTIYLTSDGYADQFGGEKGKKFMVKRFYELLRSIQHQDMFEQDETLARTFDAWRGDIQQVDDILVVGIRF